MKAVVAAFNQEKALVGAFSVIVQLHRLIVNSSCDILTKYDGRVAPAAGDNVSDSGESHAYYSRVAKDFSLEPPPLKEHLYQNFDQVFLAMEDQRQQQ